MLSFQFRIFNSNVKAKRFFKASNLKEFSSVPTFGRDVHVGNHRCGTLNMSVPALRFQVEVKPLVCEKCQRLIDLANCNVNTTY